jgi:hypothetical protein
MWGCTECNVAERALSVADATEKSEKHDFYLHSTSPVEEFDRGAKTQDVPFVPLPPLAPAHNPMSRCRDCGDALAYCLCHERRGRTPRKI